MITRSTVEGALLGCAVGDTMGAPFEGLWSASIPSPESLLASFHEYHGFPLGQYTDDTQLTLATLESIAELREWDLADIARRIAELWRHHAIIGPGGACTHAAEHFLANGDWTTMGALHGQAGNGTAMRTAVVGLWFVDEPASLPEYVSTLSRLTHTDPRSVAGGVAIAEAARYLATTRPPLDPDEFCAIVARSCRDISPEFADLIEHVPTRYADREFIAWAGQQSPEFDEPIITPFVIPTVLASLACVIEHPDSWNEATTAAIRWGGDVDTLGAIVGALTGARHGIGSIPSHLVDTLANSEYLRVVADRFHSAIRARA